jgi:dTDP-4-amino-4,6-dideoxygalactose transaminase
VLLLPALCQTSHVYNQFVVRAPGRRDALRAHLASRNVGTGIYYPVPMHLQRCFANLGHCEGDFPVAEAAARDSLALPVFGELSEDEIRYVASAVIEFFGG